MHSEETILAWLVETVAKETLSKPSEIDPDKSVHALGIDSALVISLTFDLEDKFGVALDPTTLFEQKSLRTFSNHLAEHLRKKAGTP